MTDHERGVHAATDPNIDTTATPTRTNPVSSAATGDAAGDGRPRPKRGRRARWLVAAGLIAVVVALTGAAAVVLTGAAPAATVVGYVPADSVMYGEIRLDLPGDQRQKVGQFLSKFPGFADQAALDTKIDEVLDRLVGQASSNEQTVSRDIKPWFDGQVAFSMGPLPRAASRNVSDQAAATRALVLISIKDGPRATAWFDRVMSKAGAAGTTEAYNGTDLHVFSTPDMPGVKGAFGIIGGKVAVAGDLTSVKAAVDSKGASALANAPGFAAASTASSPDHLGFMYIDLRSVMDAALSMAGSGGGVSMPPVSQAMLGQIPDWGAFQLRIEADALVMDGTTPDVPAAPGPTTNHANGVAAWAPPSTVILVAGDDSGKTALQTLALLRADPSTADALKSVDQKAGILGGLDGTLSWMGDTGIVVAKTGDTMEGGLVSIPADAAKARQLLTTIRSFAMIAGGQQGITVRDADYAGTTITTIDLGSIADLAGMVGALSGGSVPTVPAAGLPDGHVEISYAATDSVVVIGSGPAFVQHVLDAGAGASLGADARFQALVARAGAQHTAIGFIDIAAIRTSLEGLMSAGSAQQRAKYDTSLKPFLSPFDALVMTSVAGPDLDRQHLIVTVK